MNTNYRQRLENFTKLEEMIPAVLDMIDDINTMPSSSFSEMKNKIQLIFKSVDFKDSLIDQIAMAKIALNEKQKEFLKGEEGLARDVS